MESSYYLRLAVLLHFWKLEDDHYQFKAFVSLLWSLEIPKALGGQALRAAYWLAFHCMALL